MDNLGISLKRSFVEWYQSVWSCFLESDVRSRTNQKPPTGFKPFHLHPWVAIVTPSLGEVQLKEKSWRTTKQTNILMDKIYQESANNFWKHAEAIYFALSKIWRKTINLLADMDCSAIIFIQSDQWLKYQRTTTQYDSICDKLGVFTQPL